MITHNFPPAGGSGVQRVLKFAKYLGRFGWEPYILTAKKPHLDFADESLLCEVLKDVTIYRTATFSLPNPFTWISKPEQIDIIRGGISKVKRLLMQCIRKIFIELLPIDIFICWLPFALKKGREVIDVRKIDLIYATGDPFSNFLVGYFLKKATKKPLVLDYRDSWTSRPSMKRRYFGIKIWVNSFFEKKIIAYADKIITAKWITKESILKKFPSVAEDKFSVITNGYDSSDFENIVSAETMNGKLEIVFIGKLGLNTSRSPLTFLRALKMLIADKEIDPNTVRFRIIGGIDKKTLNLIKDEGLNEVTEFVGYLDHKGSIREMLKADILLLIIESPYGWEYSKQWSGVIPAKLFEYIYADKPIFAIIPDGFEAELIRKTGLPFIAQPNNINDVKNKLREIYNYFKKGALRCKTSNRRFIEKYERRNLTMSLASAFDQLLENMNKGKIAY